MCVYICVYIYIYQINNNRNVMDGRMDGEMNTWIVSNFLKMYSYSSGFSGISQWLCVTFAISKNPGHAMTGVVTEVPEIWG